MDVETKTPGTGERPWLDQKAKPFIRIDKVTKKFGDFTAVDTVSLDIFKGELFALLGGSGCGKTTLLRMLAGFEMPTEGRLFLDGQDMTDMPPYERPVNMMFQSYALFPHMTVEKNVGYGLKHEAMTDSQRKDRVKPQDRPSQDHGIGKVDRIARQAEHPGCHQCRWVAARDHRGP